MLKESFPTNITWQNLPKKMQEDDYTIVEFREVLSGKRIKSLFAYLSRRMQGRVEYNEECQGRIGWEILGGWVNAERRKIFGLYLSISCKINNQMGTLSFNPARKT